MSKGVVSYSPFCMHCGGVMTNEDGETKVYCHERDCFVSVTKGECFGNCEAQEVIDGGKPWKWIAPEDETYEDVRGMEE